MTGKFHEPTPHSSQPAEKTPSPGLRVLLVVCGTLAVGLGILGVLLPLLPTTPFLLLAAACYVRSSPRLYHWLVNNQWTGEYIRNYREGRGLPRRAKAATLALLWGTLLLSAYLVANPWIWLALGAVALVVPAFILSLPTLEGDRERGEGTES